ncbi:uncharacterized protein PHACADRAFT_262055 [Phanerochaete carnosa HHB-10118-sp]|uniref:F-box domain-containing protein n=1 Tax=Phanerochaete carnosa (strain HHB-10118-sp) TaxID=650164 RepID=K5WN41_PHACS|nr:uncharacterized protein PHACADRAFT_262055 [Phanerochaete carnosa HHB-10118-sp]EKM51742.1 hypothetical protein PHACADRAFT_262055 [Phanerochaete carnosa HHB-10118-sp]
MVGLRLPQELTDEIISFVEDDRETLAYASLVCRAWLQCSRRRLFRSIKLDGPSAVDFLNYLSVGQGGEDADASASSAKDIRKLRLVGSGPSDQGDNLYVGVILRMLSLLPNLEHLSVEHGTFVASQEQLDAATVSLKELRILNAHVPLETPQALLQLLSIFNRIDSLYLSSLTWDSVSVDPAGAASSPIPAADQPAFPLHLQVSCFTLVSRRRSFIPAILALMQRTKSIHTLSDIRLQCNDAACITAAGAFLSHPNAVVRSLSVDLAFPTGGMTCEQFTI